MLTPSNKPQNQPTQHQPNLQVKIKPQVPTIKTSQKITKPPAIRKTKIQGYNTNEIAKLADANPNKTPKNPYQSKSNPKTNKTQRKPQQTTTKPKGKLNPANP